MIHTNDRPLKKEEKEYTKKWSNTDRINYWLFQSMIYILILYSSFAAFKKGIFDEGGVGLIVIFTSGIFASYVIFKYEGKSRFTQVDEKTKVKRKSGALGLKRKAHLYKYFINGMELRVPGHWEAYLSDGDLVEAQVCSTPNKNYLLGTSSGLSIQLERENGYTAPFSHHPTSYYLLTLGTISACGVVAGVMFNLGWTGDPELERPSTLTGFFDGPLELSFLFAALLLVPPTLWYIYRHFQDVSKIREMYEEEFGLEPWSG